MERLIKRIHNQEGKNIVVYTMGAYEDTVAGEMTGGDIRTVLRALANYEDAEEQGLLLKLPCKVGNMVYSIRKGLTYGEVGDKPKEWSRIDKIKFSIHMLNDFDKTIFLTQAEAEAALNKIESEK